MIGAKRVEKTVKAVVQGLTIEVQMNLIDSSMSKLMFQGSKLIWLYQKPQDLEVEPNRSSTR